MLNSAQLKAKAKTGLEGNWGTAIGTTIVAGILGAADGNGPNILNINFGSNGVRYSDNGTEWINGSFDLPPAMVSAMFGVAGLAIIFSIAVFIISGMISMGYSRFNLNLIDYKPANLSDLFAYKDYLWTGLCANFLMGLYIFLWTLLLIIPGIIATYSYSMTFFILAENPHMSASEAISYSKEMMRGHKADMFFLELSFIGWMIVGAFTLGIGYLWIAPYMQATMAAFYRDVSGTFRNKCDHYDGGDGYYREAE